jgi:hypothetical protein
MSIKLPEFFKIDKNIVTTTEMRCQSSLDPNHTHSIRVNGIDDESVMRSMLIGELGQSIQKNIIKKLVSTQNVDFEDVRGTQFDLKPFNTKYLSKYSNYKYIITNVMIGSLMQDSIEFEFKPIGNRVNSTGQIYEIGIISDIVVYVDPYMKYTDRMIILHNGVNLNTSDLIFDSYENGRIIKTRLGIGSVDSRILYLIESNDSPEYALFLQKMRDEKIDVITN